MATIGFIGSANALGMMYALDLKDAGHHILYYVTTPISDTLSRPECHFDEITYPYPEWVIEYPITHPLRANLFAQSQLPDLINALDSCDMVFLSGMFLMLAPHLSNAKVIFLSHGSDLDVWCDRTNIIHHIKNAFAGRAITGSMASALAIHKMRKSFSSCKILITFPFGLSSLRDFVVHDLTKNWNGQIVQRFDVSFRALSSASRKPPLNEDKLVLLCAVRCSFLSEPGVSPSDLKGVDSILRGIGQYVTLNRMPIELHIIEKGKDLQAAKYICTEAGLSKVTTWHKEMPFRDLIKLYEQADICFDQIADSWLGAIGCYGLYMGRSLIANPRLDVHGATWGESVPICSATDSQQVCDWLIKLESTELRKKYAELSATFAEKKLGPSLVLSDIKEALK